MRSVVATVMTLLLLVGALTVRVSGQPQSVQADRAASQDAYTSINNLQEFDA